MNITNAQFTSANSITALVDGVQVTIPTDAGNRHYRELLDAGVAIADYVEPEVVSVVSQDDLIATLLARIESLEASK